MKNSKLPTEEVGNRLYCSRCDSYRPLTMFNRNMSYCKDCQKNYTTTYMRNIHDRAVAALGGQCQAPTCDVQYDPPKHILYMMRLSTFEDWLPHPLTHSQYSRDRKIVDDPEDAAPHILMVCKDHKPHFISLAEHLKSTPPTT
jgi:hypothetical protein